MMYEIAFKPVSNRASWQVAVKVTGTDNQPIDLSPFSMVFAVNDKNGGGPHLLASTENGKLTYQAVGVFSWFFTREEMGALCAGIHQTGLTITNEDGTQTAQLSVGPLPIIDGVVP